MTPLKVCMANSAYMERGRTKCYAICPKTVSSSTLKSSRYFMCISSSSADFPVQGVSVYRPWVVPWCQSCQALAATDRQQFRSAQSGEQPLPAHFVIHRLRLLIALWNGEKTDDEQNAAPDKFPSTVNTTHLAVNKEMLSGGAGLCVS